MREGRKVGRESDLSVSALQRGEGGRGDEMRVGGEVERSISSRRNSARRKIFSLRGFDRKISTEIVDELKSQD